MKGTIDVLTRCLAKELNGRKITVNTVAPGAIATDFSGGIVRDNPEMNKRIADMTALDRAGVPDDIALRTHVRTMFEGSIDTITFIYQSRPIVAASNSLTQTTNAQSCSNLENREGDTRSHSLPHSPVR